MTEAEILAAFVAWAAPKIGPALVGLLDEWKILKGLDLGAPPDVTVPARIDAAEDAELDRLKARDDAAALAARTTEPDR